MAGMNRETGRQLAGWAHTVQSIGVILTTAIRERVMRREFGSTLPEQIDKPINALTLQSMRQATAEALHRWEPRYRTRLVSVDAAAAGTVRLTLVGDYYPRGHLGDYSTKEPRDLNFIAELVSGVYQVRAA
jgi:phage baseplate assembly protein W